MYGIYAVTQPNQTQKYMYSSGTQTHTRTRADTSTRENRPRYAQSISHCEDRRVYRDTKPVRFASTAASSSPPPIRPHCHPHTQTQRARRCTPRKCANPIDHHIHIHYTFHRNTPTNGRVTPSVHPFRPSSIHPRPHHHYDHHHSPPKFTVTLRAVMCVAFAFDTQSPAQKFHFLNDHRISFGRARALYQFQKHTCILVFSISTLTFSLPLSLSLSLFLFHTHPNAHKRSLLHMLRARAALLHNPHFTHTPFTPRCLPTNEENKNFVPSAHPDNDDDDDDETRARSTCVMCAQFNIGRRALFDIFLCVYTYIQPSIQTHTDIYICVYVLIFYMQERCLLLMLRIWQCV